MMIRTLSSITLVACVALSLAACGDDTDSAKKSTPSKPRVKCSATNSDVKLYDSTGLPAKVATTRERIFDAAVDCDYKALAAIAEKNPDFGFTRDGEKDPVAYWRAQDKEQRTMDRLARIMAGPYVQRSEGYAAYGWPSVFQDEPGPLDYGALVKTGAYTQEEADAFQQAGSYTGYRVQIKPDGTWDFFFNGD